jgi:hypothetical protein
VPNGVNAEAVRAHVARITASDVFAGAERLCRFLHFTVESKLSGHEDRIKEYVLGREVYDRGENYDTRLDPIVRVEARRLRDRLLAYYAGPGRGEALRIEYPKGKYVPEIREPVEPRSTRRAAIVGSWIAALAVVMVAVAAVAIVVASRRSEPALIAPLPASWVQENVGDLDASDAALAEAVDEHMANRPGFAVVAWPEILQRKSRLGVPFADIAAQLHAGTLLLVLVRDDGPARRADVFVIEEPSGRKRLALRYPDASLTPYAQDALAARIVADLERLREP